MSEQSSPQEAPPVCPRHPDTVSYVRCQRCGRPVCPACQRQAAVGVQCVDCVDEGRRTVRTGRTIFGGTVTDGRPVLTFGILGVTVAFFLLAMAAPEVRGYLAFNAVWARVEPWRFLTVVLTHAGTMHILFNMYALYLLGQFLEPALGRARFFALYLLSGLGGSVLILLLAGITQPWSAWTVGASGAVFGLFGALLVLQRRLGVSNNGLYIVLAINAAISFIFPQISWEGHLGGFIVGLLAGLVFSRLTVPGGPGKPADFSRHWLGLAAIGVALVALAAGRYLLV